MNIFENKSPILLHIRIYFDKPVCVNAKNFMSLLAINWTVAVHIHNIVKDHIQLF